MDQIDLSAPVSTLFSKDTQMKTIANGMGGGGAVGSSYQLTGCDGGGAYMTQDYNGYYWGLWEPYREYHHVTYHHIPTSDSFERSFKLARALMAKKLVKPLKTIEDFFKLMDAIVEELR